MSGRPDQAFGDRSGGPAGSAWGDPAGEAPDPVDDGIAVGVPPLDGEPAGEETGPGGEAGGEHGGEHGGAVSGGEPAGDRLRAERDQYLEALQRLQADFENYRKRVQRQQEEQGARAAGDLVGKLLPVLDTLDLARAHLLGADGADPAGEAAALEQARAQLLDLLGREGLERVDGAGVAFDPVVHDAVAHAESTPDDPAGSVVVEEVLRAGYRWRGQVLRPAMVRVRG